MLLPKQPRVKCLQLSYWAGEGCVPSWLMELGSRRLLPCRVCRAPWSHSELNSLQGPYSFLILTIHLPCADNTYAQHEAQNQAILLWKPGWRRDLLIALSLFTYKMVEVRLFAKETNISCLPEERSSCLLPGCHQAEKKMRFRECICKKKQVCG